MSLRQRGNITVWLSDDAISGWYELDRGYVCKQPDPPWPPRALVEHKITVSNLKRLIFGKGDKTTKQQDKSPKAEQNNTAPEEPAPSASTDENHEPKEPKGHGRLPHTAYINTNEHTIPLESLSSGQPCPLYCGGKLYLGKQFTILCCGILCE